MATDNAATNAPTNAESAQPALTRFTEALSELSGRASAPDDRSGGLDLLMTAAQMAAALHREIDDMLSYYRRRCDPEALAILQRAQDDSYDTWQQIERNGLPLLQRWQRESLGYSEQELSR